MAQNVYENNDADINLEKLLLTWEKKKPIIAPISVAPPTPSAVSNTISIEKPPLRYSIILSCDRQGIVFGGISCITQVLLIRYQ